MLTARRAAAPLLLAITLLGCDTAPPPAEPEIRPVRYAPVVAAGGVETRTFSGAARAELESDLSFKVGGTLVELPVDVGDRVAAGALIGSLQPTDYQVVVEEAEAGLAQARAQERNASASYERTRGLYENRNASRSDLDSARAAYESSRAAVRAAAQRLESARLQLSYTRLYSPADCTIAQRLAEVNQNVSPGQPVATVNCGDCPEVVVNVPEVYIERVSDGMPAEVSIDAVGRRSIPGTVSEVGVATAPRGATYPVTIRLGEACKEVRSGMAAEATITLPSIGAEDELLVPLVAVGEDRDGNYVFVLEPAGGDGGHFVARRRTVTTGMPAADGIGIVSGLAPGELVVTAGVRRISDGQTVRLLAAD